MIEFVDDTMQPWDYRHWADEKDIPACGVSAAGRFVVESAKHVSCPACLEMTKVPTILRTPGGRS